MAIITRFGGSGGTPIVDPYPHVWECTVVQSGTTCVVSGVVSLEAYDILHYTMPLGFSTYDLMIGGVTYHTSFRNEGEMYIQWTGSDFVVVSANAACALPHVWVNPTYAITGSVLEITAGIDDLHTNDVIELTLASGESASVIEYDSNTYTINIAIGTGVNYIKFNGTSFENGLFNFLGDATASDVLNGKTFYSNSGVLLAGNLSVSNGLSLFENYQEVLPSFNVDYGTPQTKHISYTLPSEYLNNKSNALYVWVYGSAISFAVINDVIYPNYYISAGDSTSGMYIRIANPAITSTTLEFDLTYSAFQSGTHTVPASARTIHILGINSSEANEVQYLSYARNVGDVTINGDFDINTYVIGYPQSSTYGNIGRINVTQPISSITINIGSGNTSFLLLSF